MRKEILIATIAGIIVGLLIAFGSWRANSALKVKTSSTINKQTASSNSNGKGYNEPSKSNKDDLPSLTLTNIEDLDVLTESNIKIAGISKPNSLIVMSTENEDYIIKSGNDGSFEQEIELKAGVNQILLTAFSIKSDRYDKALTLIYSTEFDKDISLNGK